MRRRVGLTVCALAAASIPASCQRAAPPRPRHCTLERAMAEHPAPQPASRPAAAGASCPAGMVLLPGGVDRAAHMRMTGAFAGVLPGGEAGTPIAPFCLDRTEATVGAYRACVERGACSAPDSGESCNWADPTRVDHPINCVDWCQAAAFCRAVGKRLPTALEWLWAARGGARGWTFPWGAEPPDDTRLCWRRYDFDRRRGAGTCPAESFPRGASPEGVLGLAGNVREWTATAWRFAATMDELSVRGGAWENDPRYTNVHSESDYRYAPWYREPTIGFRCAADPR